MILLDNLEDELNNDLEKFVQSNIINDMEKHTEQINDNLISNFIEVEKMPLASTFGLEEINEEINSFEKYYDTLKRNDYMFPKYFNIGNLKHFYNLENNFHNFLSKSSFPFFFNLESGGIGIYQNIKYKKEIIDFLEKNLIKFILSVPNGLSELKLIDPSGGGKNFKETMKFDKDIIGDKVITSEEEITRVLKILKNEIETINKGINKVGFKDIQEYNKSVKSNFARYKILGISSFPYGFTKESIELLSSIIQSGQNAGVFIFISIDKQKEMPYGTQLRQITDYINLIEPDKREHMYIRNKWIKSRFTIANFLDGTAKEQEILKDFINSKVSLTLDSTIPKIDNIVNLLNKKIKTINLKPDIDINLSLPKEMWQEKPYSELKIPIGKIGIMDQLFDFSNESGVYHAMICGKTGSGKTVLLHDMINLAVNMYSPLDFELYLLDYKEGTEFAMYKDLPHTSILSMQSELDFGISVFEHILNKEIPRRGNLFKKYGVSNLHNYMNELNKAYDNDEIDNEEFQKNKLTRILFVIDEFQALFTENDKIAQKARKMLDIFVRKARSFGINIVLATQTLAGIDMEKSTLSNIGLRIALMMEEQDVVRLMSQDNKDAVYLNKPGAGIYNDRNGLSEGNKSFQAFFCKDEDVNETIKRSNEKYLKYSNIEKSNLPNKFIYNGTIPGNINNNEIYQNQLDFGNFEQNKQYAKIYIGESVDLRDEDIHFNLKREFDSNVLIVGSGNENSVKMNLNILNQVDNYNSDKTIDKFYIFNYSSSDNKYKTLLSENNLNFKNTSLKIIQNNQTNTNINEIYNIYKERKNSLDENNKIDRSSWGRIVCSFIHIKNIKELQSENYENSESLTKLKELIKNASEYGINIIIYANKFQVLIDLELHKMIKNFNIRIGLNGGDNDKLFSDDKKSKNLSDFFGYIESTETKTEIVKYKIYKEI